jgi:hypothetical protein
MLPCEDLHKLIEEHLAGTLDEERRQAVANHLRVCSDCHRAVEEARLASLILREANTPPPPPDLASNIKSAARTRLAYRQRPLHKRALGSPVFMATCASLLCGALLCLVAIVRVGSVSPAGSVLPTLAAPPVVVHSLVTVKPSRPVVAQTSVRANSQVSEAPSLSQAPRVAAASRPARALQPPARAASAAVARSSRHNVRSMVKVASHARDEIMVPVSYLTPSRQRVSLPGAVVGSASAPASRSLTDLPGPDESFVTVDLAGALPARHTDPSRNE